MVLEVHSHLRGKTQDKHSTKLNPQGAHTHTSTWAHKHSKSTSPSHAKHWRRWRIPLSALSLALEITTTVAMSLIDHNHSWESNVARTVMKLDNISSFMPW